MTCALRVSLAVWIEAAADTNEGRGATQDHMRTAGTVNFCNVMGANGRSKGCGLVEFATPEEAQHAIQTLHDSELDGRKIFCREDREVSQQDDQSVVI